MRLLSGAHCGGMQLNNDTSVTSRLTNKKHALCFNYNIGDFFRQEVSEYTHLGVAIQKSLKGSISASATRKHGLVKRKLKASPPELSLLAYYSLVRPALQYCILVFTKKKGITVFKASCAIYLW